MYLLLYFFCEKPTQTFESFFYRFISFHILDTNYFANYMYYKLFSQFLAFLLIVFWQIQVYNCSVVRIIRVCPYPLYILCLYLRKITLTWGHGTVLFYFLWKVLESWFLDLSIKSIQNWLLWLSVWWMSNTDFSPHGCFWRILGRNVAWVRFCLRLNLVNMWLKTKTWEMKLPL